MATELEIDAPQDGYFVDLQQSAPQAPSIAVEAPPMSLSVQFGESAEPIAVTPETSPISMNFNNVAPPPAVEPPTLSQSFEVAAVNPEPINVVEVTSEMTNDAGVTSIVTNPNIAYDAENVSMHLESVPVVEVLDTIFGLSGGPTDEVAQLLPDEPVIIQPTPAPQPVQNTWTPKPELDAPSGMA